MVNEAGVGRITSPSGVLKGTPLEVRYQEKDSVKDLGAIWDNELRLWYVPPGRDLRPFLRWLPRSIRLVDADTRNEPPVAAELSEAPPRIRLWTPALLELGQQVGAELDQHLSKVTRSATIMSPFLTPSLLDRLRHLQARGIAVSLLTSSQDLDRPEVAARLISQERHVDDRARERRARGMRYSVYATLTLFATAIAGAFIHVLSLLLLIGLPIVALVWLYFHGTRVFSYSYRPLFSRLRIIDTPFVHSKVYILDDEVAYLGSFNFTFNGLRNNFETSVRVTDPAAVESLGRLLDALFDDAAWVERPTSAIAAAMVRRGVWREPRH